MSVRAQRTHRGRQMMPWRRGSPERREKGVCRRLGHYAGQILLVRMRRQARGVVCLAGCGKGLLRQKARHGGTLHGGEKREQMGFNTRLTTCNVEYNLLPPPLKSIWSITSACCEGLSAALGTALWLFVRAFAVRAARMSCEEESSD